MDILQNVAVVLVSYNEKNERGTVVSASGSTATLNASTLRKAGLAVRRKDRLHRIDSRLRPGCPMVVNIQKTTKPNSDRVISVTAPKKQPSQLKNLPVDTRGIGLVSKWFPEKSFGFVRVEKLLDSEGNPFDLNEEVNDLFFHRSDIKPDLLAQKDLMLLGEEVRFTVMPNSDGRTKAKIMARQ